MGSQMEAFVLRRRNEKDTPGGVSTFVARGDQLSAAGVGLVSTSKAARCVNRR